MYNQANTIKSYEDIRRTVRGGPILTLTQKSILTFFLLMGISGGLMLADCWGKIPATQEPLQMQAHKSSGNMHLFLQQQFNPLSTASKTGQHRLKTMTKTGRTATQLRHQRQNEKLRKRIRARKALLEEKRKYKIGRILFLVSISKPLNKP